jgi:hypothetical protein
MWASAGLAVVLAGAAGFLLFYRDHTTPVTAADVAAILELSDAGGSTIYAMDTIGFETVDALSGARHDYQPTSYLVARSGGCGTLIRWQPIKERWTEWEYCSDRSLAGWTSYNEWFGVPNVDTWTCDSPIPTSGDPGDVWSVRCTEEDASKMVHHEVVGVEALDIGAQPVEVLHLRSWSGDADAPDEDDVADVWYVPDGPLLARRTDRSTTTSPSRIGSVEYHEEYSITLASLTPIE